jgi:hypothetical protein
MLRQFLTGGCIALLGLVLSGPAQATPVYSYKFDKSTYDVTPGGTVTVQVFLEEKISPGDSSLFENPGLIGAGVKVTFNDTVVQVKNLSDIVTNPQFNDDPTALSTTNLVPGISADLTENVGLGTPVTSNVPGPTTFDILAGTFTFTADAAAPGGHVTMLTASRRDPASNDNVGADLPPTVLDGQLQNATATIMVVPTGATPEPASLLLWAATWLGLLGYAWIRRRRVTVKPA